MEITRVIKSPVLTEKSNDALGKNVYTFEVDWARQTSSKLKELLSLYSRLRCYQLTHLKLTNNLKV